MMGKRTPGKNNKKNKKMKNKKMDNNQNQKSEIGPTISVGRKSNNTYPGCGHEKAVLLKRTVDIMRNTVKIKPNPKNSEQYSFEFDYDAHVKGRIAFYLFVIGSGSANMFPTVNMLFHESIDVEKGPHQKFESEKYQFYLPLYKSGLAEEYHFEIKTQASSSKSEPCSTDPKDESTDNVSQSTVAVFEEVKGENQVRVTHQLVWVNGVKYVCHDFLGLYKRMDIAWEDLANICLLCKSREYPGIHSPIGKISITGKENIVKGSIGTLVFEGTYDGSKVAVKRIPSERRDVANNEIQILKESDHRNIVRLYGTEDDGRFVYIALEKCECNLHDLISCDELKLGGVRDLKLLRKDEKDNTEVKTYPLEELMEILRDIVKGIAHLHGLGINHGNVHPQNILIHKGTSITAKLSGFGLSKSSLTESTAGIGSSGWQPRELLPNEGQDLLAVDLFSFGILVFFCITGGRHPFGDVGERVENIRKNCKKDLKLVNHLREACDLINCLIHPKSKKRPTITQVRSHPFFWDPETRLSFLKVSSDIVELKEESKSDDYNPNLQNSMLIIEGYHEWHDKLDDPLGKDIKRRGGDLKEGLRGLLRAIRNKYNHIVDFNGDIREVLGEVATTIDAYFREKFPSLLMDVHGVMKQHREEGPFFQKYYQECRF